MAFKSIQLVFVAAASLGLFACSGQIIAQKDLDEN